MRKPIDEFEDICCLGISTTELIPLAMPLIERAIGGHLFRFIWADKQLQVANVYSTEAIPIGPAQAYVAEFYNRREGEVAPTFSEALRQRLPIVNYFDYGRRLMRSALYSEIFIPLKMHHAIRVPVFEGERTYGMLSSARARGEAPFTRKDEQDYVRVARHLAHAFELERVGRLLGGQGVTATEEGLLIVDQHGKVLHGSDLGLRLMVEATRPDGFVAPAAKSVSLLAHLAARLQGAQGTAAAVERVANRRGKFEFRAVALRGMGTGVDAPTAVTVRRLGSLASRLWQESARFHLSGRERQATVMLGLGYGYDEVAERLQLTRNTVTSYVRRAYEKIGIHQREELVRVLLAG